jgi:peptidoglycan/xylan/chitin deacetylase (PgdA/CDA1 family)
MLHRFADPVSGRPGHDTAVLREHLGWLRRQRIVILPVGELLRRLGAGEPVYKAVSFTVDDGYADFAELGLPVFAEFDCPVTVFLTTDFLDGRCWLWWNQVECAIRETGRDGVRLEHAAGSWEFRWTGDAERRAACDALVERLKTVSEAERRELVSRLVSELAPGLPARPPAEFAPLTWDQVRRCAGSGVTFGPHTRTHPILSRTDAAQAAEEIGGSWRRVREEAADAAVPVFCYPNGDADSFGAREQDLVRQAGLDWALTAIAGYATREVADPARRGSRYAVPRMPYVQAERSFVQVSSGLERAKRLLGAVTGRSRAG